MKLSRSLVAVFTLAALAMFGRLTMAGDDVVAPFIDSKTDLIFHADAAGADLSALGDLCTRMITTSDLDPAAQNRAATMLGAAIGSLKSWQDDFKKAGGKDVYIVIRFQYIDPEPMNRDADAPAGVGIIVPLGEGADADALGKAFTSRMNTNGDAVTAVVVGKALVITDPKSAASVKKPSTEARPDLLESLKVGPDGAAIHLALAPAAMDQLQIPFLPVVHGPGAADKAANASSGMMWAGMSFSLPPAESVRLVQQCKDADAATATKDQWNKAVAATIDAEPKAAFGDKAAAVATALNAKTDGSKVVVGIDKTALDAIIQAALTGKLNVKAQTTLTAMANTRPSTNPVAMPPVIKASETDALVKLEGQTVTVEGKVDRVVTASDRVLLVTFQGNDRTGFTAVITKDKDPDAHAHFAGDAGNALAGKLVHITGKIMLYRGRPEIEINAIDQVGEADEGF